jgi:prophage regulatory protein
MRFLRLPQVQARVGLSPMTIWRREKARSFPRRVKLGPNSVAWVEEEIDQWCAARAAARDQADLSPSKA